MRVSRPGVGFAACLVASLMAGVLPQSTAESAASAAAAIGPGAQRGTADRPNIVLISADDMRTDDLRFMPHTRKLIASRGVSFTNAMSN